MILKVWGVKSMNSIEVIKIKVKDLSSTTKNEWEPGGPLSLEIRKDNSSVVTSNDQDPAIVSRQTVGRRTNLPSEEIILAHQAVAPP